MVASPNPYTPTTPGIAKPYQPTAYQPTAYQPAAAATQASAYAPERSGRGTNTGGVSAVNPQAGQMDYDALSTFTDAAYNQAMTRLNPQMQQQSSKFDQDMINRGIGVGSEAYNEAKQQMDFGQDDARQNAAFNAMQFGTGIQNQMFGQDAQRSQLANALLQAQMQNDLGYSNLNEQGREFNDRLNQQGEQFGQQLNQQGDQFGQQLNQQGDQFLRSLNEQGRQFDENLFNNQYQYGDQSNYQWDRAQMNDLGWLANFDRDNQRYNDQQDWNYFNANQGLLGAIPGWNPAQIDVAGNAGAATNSQNAAFNAQNAMNQQAWSQITDVMGMGAMAMGSDIRLKQDIKPIGRIGEINIYRWNWNDKAKRLGIGKQPTIGVIAQEVPQEFVSVKDGYLAVNYEELFNATQ